MRKLLRAAALALLIASPLASQVCDQSFTLRTTACPAGALDCTNKGSSLTYAEGDENFLNLIDLCKPFDVASTTVTVAGDWTFTTGITLGAVANPQFTLDDSDTTVETTDFQIRVNASDTDAGEEDVDCWFSSQVNSVLVDWFNCDADNAGTAEFNLGFATLGEFNLTTDAGLCTIDGGLDCAAHPTLGGVMAIKEGADETGGNTFGFSIPDVGGIAASLDCEVQAADAKIPTSCIGDHTETMNWSAGSWSTDGTGCTDAAETEIPASSGIKTWEVSCADSDTARAYHNAPTPAGWDAGSVLFTLYAHHATSESLTCLYDVTCQCIGDGEAAGTTFTTESASTEISLVFTTLANQTQYASQSGAITCTGTCAAADWLRWKLEVDANGSGPNCANVNLTNMKMAYATEMD